MRGHVSKSRNRYHPVIELGYQPAQRCTGCGRRAGWLAEDQHPSCPRCGSELEEREERRQRWHEGFRRKKDAQQALAALLGSHDAGTYVAPTRQTVASYLTDEWLGAIEHTIRASTLLSYRGHIRNHIAPHLGSVQLQKLNGNHINQLYARLLETGLSPATVRRVHATLHRAMKDAMRWNKIARNPADQADPPTVSADRDADSMSTWPADELRRFLQFVKGDRLYPLWLLYSTTGMRRGEALGLRPEDVDLTAGRVAVRQALISVGYKIQISKPKRKRSRRSIPLDAGTSAALKAWRVSRAEERLAWGSAYQDCGLFFTREDGSRLHVSRDLRPARVRA